VLAPGADASFEALEQLLAGPIELSVLPVGSRDAVRLGGDRLTHGWSTTKVPVLVALLNALGSAGLSDQETLWAHAAITESDNQSILDLFGVLERDDGGLEGASEAVEQQLRGSDDRHDRAASRGRGHDVRADRLAPGARGALLCGARRRCLLDARKTRYVLGLMQNIVPSESWGLGAAGFSHVAFKGGWGPEGAKYLVRQSGIIEPETPRAVAVAIVAFPPAGPT
jgi:hypothetical protein